MITSEAKQSRVRRLTFSLQELLNDVSDWENLFRFSQTGLVGIIHYFVSLYDRKNESGYFENNSAPNRFSNWVDVSIPVVMDSLGHELDVLFEHNALPSIAKSNEFYDLLQYALCDIAEKTDSYMRDYYRRDRYDIDDVTISKNGLYVSLILEK